MAYRGDGWQDGLEALLAGPPAVQRGPGAGAGLAAVGLAWLLRNQGEDSGVGLCDQSLHYRNYFQLNFISITLGVKQLKLYLNKKKRKNITL